MQKTRGANSAEAAPRLPVLKLLMYRTAPQGGPTCQVGRSPTAPSDSLGLRGTPATRPQMCGCCASGGGSGHEGRHGIMPDASSGSIWRRRPDAGTETMAEHLRPPGLAGAPPGPSSPPTAGRGDRETRLSPSNSSQEKKICKSFDDDKKNEMGPKLNST